MAGEAGPSGQGPRARTSAQGRQDSVRARSRANSRDQIGIWVEIKGKIVACVRSVESLHRSLLVFFPPSFFKGIISFLFYESESIVFLFIVLFFNKCINLFLAALGLCCSTRVSHRDGFSCCGSRAPGRRLSSCGAHGTWNLPGPGMEPMSPPLAGRPLTTMSPEKSSSFFLS